MTIPKRSPYFGQAYARSGNRNDAEKILARLTEEAKTRYVSAYNMALMFLGLGEKEKALDALERAYNEGAGTIFIVIQSTRCWMNCAKIRVSKRLPRRLFRRASSVRLRNEFPQFLFRAKATQCLQGCHCLHRRGLGAFAGIAQVFPVFDVPNWTIRLLVLLIVLGLPVALSSGLDV